MDAPFPLLPLLNCGFHRVARRRCKGPVFRTGPRDANAECTPRHASTSFCRAASVGLYSPKPGSGGSSTRSQSPPVSLYKGQSPCDVNSKTSVTTRSVVRRTLAFFRCWEPLGRRDDVGPILGGRRGPLASSLFPMLGTAGAPRRRADLRAGRRKPSAPSGFPRGHAASAEQRPQGMESAANRCGNRSFGDKPSRRRSLNAISVEVSPGHIGLALASVGYSPSQNQMITGFSFLPSELLVLLGNQRGDSEGFWARHR